MENDNYESLYSLVQPYINKKFCDLPDNVRDRLKAETIVKWDDLAPEQRSAMTRQHDMLHDPENDEENTHWWNIECEIFDLEKQLAEYELMSHGGIPSEALLRATRISALKNELAECRKKRELPFLKRALGTSSANDKSLEPSPGDWKTRVQAEATRMIIAGRKQGAQPVVYSIIHDLARWCRNENVRTLTGIFPSAEYLRTHVLSGKHWSPPKPED